MVLGGHGDDMVPVLSMTTINGIPASTFIAKDKLQSIIEAHAQGRQQDRQPHGHERVLRRRPPAVAMAEAYLLDQKRVLARRRAAPRWREYGYKDHFHGRPRHHRQ